MATQLKRIEFKQRYPAFHQGLFIVLNSKRLPKDQAEVNIGRVVSTALAEIPAEDRPAMVSQVLGDTVASYTAVTLTHPEILFSPDFHLDVIGTLLTLCRNRKMCITWPGTMLDGKLFYATPDSPEYYECDPRALQDSGSCHIHDTFESRHFDSPKYSQNWNVLLPAIIRCAFLHCSEHRFHLHETIIHTKPYLLSYNVHVSKNHAR